MDGERAEFVDASEVGEVIAERVGLNPDEVETEYLSASYVRIHHRSDGDYETWDVSGEELEELLIKLVSASSGWTVVRHKSKYKYADSLVELGETKEEWEAAKKVIAVIMERTEGLFPETTDTVPARANEELSSETTDISWRVQKRVLGGYVASGGFMASPFLVTLPPGIELFLFLSGVAGVALTLIYRGYR